MERKEENDREGHKFLSGHVISMPTSQPQVQPERDFAPEDSTAEAGDFSPNIISEVEQQRVTTLTDTEDKSSTTTPKKKRHKYQRQTTDDIYNNINITGQDNRIRAGQSSQRT